MDELIGLIFFVVIIVIIALDFIFSKPLSKVKHKLLLLHEIKKEKKLIEKNVRKKLSNVAKIEYINEKYRQYQLLHERAFRSIEHNKKSIKEWRNKFSFFSRFSILFFSKSLIYSSIEADMLTSLKRRLERSQKDKEFSEILLDYISFLKENFNQSGFNNDSNNNIELQIEKLEEEIQRIKNEKKRSWFVSFVTSIFAGVATFIVTRYLFGEGISETTITGFIVALIVGLITKVWL